MGVTPHEEAFLLAFRYRLLSLVPLPLSVDEDTSIHHLIQCLEKRPAQELVYR